MKKIRQISKDTSETIVIQYPTEGYGWSILPQLLCIYFSWFSSKKCIVAIHEFANRTLKAKIATSLFWLGNRIIFTSDFERKSAVSIFPLLKKKTAVIKIISNIPAPKKIKKWKERDLDLTYFGHLRPNKGLEDFFKVSRFLKDYKEIHICIMGQVLDTYKDYFDDLRMSNSDLSIEYRLNASVEEVTESLNSTKVCFLPFPDGLSERRGSFLAAIQGGARVVSYNGKFVTPALKNIAIITDRESVNETIKNLFLTSKDNSEHEDLLNTYRNYITNNIPDSWETVGKLYEKFAEQ